MKIIVKSVHIEDVSSSTGRCSDGYYRSSNYINSLNVYSDSEQISASIAKEIVHFINDNTEHGKDRIWDLSYNGESSEEINLESTKKLILILANKSIVESHKAEECTILLNTIASKIYDSHKLVISDLKNKQLKIQKKFEYESLKCKAETALKSFYDHENIYPINEIMPDFEEFPLDIARIKNDIIFFDYLINKGAISVSEPYVFAGWLCKIGKFEYLNLFVDLSKLRILRVGEFPNIENEKKRWLTGCILYYTIAYNRLDLFYKFEKEQLIKDARGICFKEDSTFNTYSSITIGRVAVKHSKLETIKNLFGKYSFFEPIPYRSYIDNYVLDVNCFRDIETASFFMEKLMVDSIYSLLYWKKNDILNQLLKSNDFNFSEIYLSGLREFLKPENNSIFEFLALVNSFSLTKQLYKKNDNFLPVCHRRNTSIMFYSVIDNCIEHKNFNLATKLFSISLKKEEIKSFDACRLLFMLYKYDENLEGKDLKQLLLKSIIPNDLIKLLGVACMENNLKLLKFLVTQIEDINQPIDIEPTSFGLSAHSEKVERIIQKYKNGTLLHLSLIANPHTLEKQLILETITILINAGVDKSIKNESGLYAFHYITDYFVDRYHTLRNNLIKLLYIEGIKICNYSGELITLFEDVDLPIVNKFKSYTSTGMNAIEAFKSRNKEALNFFLSCGAELDWLKALTESEKRKNKSNQAPTNYNYNNFYTNQELRDMYQDAFDGFDDATWNLD